MSHLKLSISRRKLRISKRKLRISKRKRRLSKRRLSRRKSRKTNTHKKRKYWGGKLEVMPFEAFGYPHGASSPREAALKIAEVNDIEQFKMNRFSGGAPGEADTKASEVDASAKVVEVPQFPLIGGIPTAYTTTDLSAGGNLTKLEGETDALNDHYALLLGGSKSRKRRTTKKKYRTKSKKYSTKRKY